MSVNDWPEEGPVVILAGNDKYKRLKNCTRSELLELAKAYEEHANQLQAKADELLEMAEQRRGDQGSSDTHS